MVPHIFGRRLFYTGVVLLLFSWEMTDGSGEITVSLEMPRFASRGSTIALNCNHNVQPQLLYKVEWLRENSKIFQYVRERLPPFRNFSILGAKLNISVSNESSIILEDLEFSASGTYSCEVSLETPIYTKPSADRELLVIQPQRHPPRITFGAPLYTAGELVEANCTTSPAHPAPHITWFINGIKVDPALSRTFTRLIPLYRSRKRHRSARSRFHSTVHPPHHHPNDIPLIGNSSDIDANATKAKGCSAKDIYGAEHYHRHSARNTLQVDDATTKHSTSLQHHKPGHVASPGSVTKPPVGQRLSITVSALRLSAGGRLSLTCLSTIPPYRGPAGRYADARNRTVIVDVVVAEELEPEPTEPPVSSASNQYVKIPTLVIFSIVNFPIKSRLMDVTF